MARADERKGTARAAAPAVVPPVEPLEVGVERLADRLGPLGAVAVALTTGLEGLSACMDAACFCCPAEGDAEEPSKKSKKAQQDVIVVAFLGSMDDFMVYFSLALSSRITPVELIIGVAIGAVLIALTVGTLLEASETLANFVESIPVPLVIFLLAVYIITSAWVPGLA